MPLSKLGPVFLRMMATEPESGLKSLWVENDFTAPASYRTAPLQGSFVMPLVSVSKAAKLFQVSRPTLQRALKSGAISGEKSVDGKVETWQIDTAELARLYSLREPQAVTLAGQDDQNGQPLYVPKISEDSDLTGEVVRGLEGQLQAVKEELAAALAVSEERRRLLDEMVKALPRPAEPKRPRRGLWGRLLGR